MKQICLSEDKQTVLFYLENGACNAAVNELGAFYSHDGYYHRRLTSLERDTLAKFAHRYQIPVDMAVWFEFERVKPTPSIFGPHMPRIGGGHLEIGPDLSGAPDIDFKDFNVDLYPYQRLGATYLYTKKRALCGDAPGVGKTFQGLGVVYLAKPQRYIVICPNSVKLNWQRAIGQALPDTDVALWGSKGGRDAEAVIINYENVTKQLVHLKELKAGLVILDEIHFLKGSKAQRTKAVKELVKDIEYIIGLSGTMILNRPKEFIQPLEIVGRLEELGGYSKFAYRYCAGFKQLIWMKVKGRPFQKQIFNIDGASNLEELHDKLRKICMIRRTKAEVLPELPEKTRAQVILPLSNRKEYEQASTDLIAYCKSIAVEEKAFKTWVNMLPVSERAMHIEKRQKDAAATAERAEQLVLINTLKKLCARGKLDGVKEWLDGYLESGEKFIMFAYHKEIQAELQKMYPGAARIVAEDSIEKREANVDKFLTPNCNLIICSLRAGGTGIDRLQHANCAVGFVEQGWTPAEHLQAEDRGHRIGRTEKMIAYYFLAEKTIDEEIQALLVKKQAICDAVLDGTSPEADVPMFNELLSNLIQKEV